ncbi:Protein of unknown function [Pyronema omphalodes CBS 100304]|uniref:Uncharacterized protein n=1 Tax=Pyronema omphalodes (strain CBS 100304) TaxID=1076935 RepID=U4KX02_PYROM|nr:Protein of unknown function [Pyronema omphalodes CBS 100304]
MPSRTTGISGTGTFQTIGAFSPFGSPSTPALDSLHPHAAVYHYPHPTLDLPAFFPLVCGYCPVQKHRCWPITPLMVHDSSCPIFPTQPDHLFRIADPHGLTRKSDYPPTCGLELKFPYQGDRVYINEESWRAGYQYPPLPREWERGNYRLRYRMPEIKLPEHMWRMLEKLYQNEEKRSGTGGNQRPREASERREASRGRRQESGPERLNTTKEPRAETRVTADDSDPRRLGRHPTASYLIPSDQSQSQGGSNAKLFGNLTRSKSTGPTSKPEPRELKGAKRGAPIPPVPRVPDKYRQPRDSRPRRDSMDEYAPDRANMDSETLRMAERYKLADIIQREGERKLAEDKAKDDRMRREKLRRTKSGRR